MLNSQKLLEILVVRIGDLLSVPRKHQGTPENVWKKIFLYLFTIISARKMTIDENEKILRSTRWSRDKERTFMEKKKHAGTEEKDEER